MKIVIVLPDLRLGGAEKNMVNLANALNKIGHSVIIVLTSGRDLSRTNEVNKSINLKILNLTRFRELLFKPVVFGNILIQEKAEVVISGFGEINPLIAFYSFWFRKIKFIARETSIPSLYVTNFWKKILYKISYNLFDSIVVQSNSMKFDLADNFSVNSSKLKLIPNLLDKDKIDISLQEEWSKFSDKFILFVGTINQNKRLDKVIKFHQRILTHLYDFDLVIVGDGPQVDQLLLHIRSSEYSNRIHFMGSTLNPYSIMRKASFLIITSDYEGFPNVGIEAQYCGCPVIVSHDTKGGAIELISDSFNGKVVNLNSDDCSFLNDVFDRKEISESIKLKHGFQNVVNRYQELF